MVTYSILPYPDTDDKQPLIDWLSSYDLYVKEHTPIGHFPKLDDFVNVLKSLPDCVHKIQSNFIGFKVEIYCGDWASEITIWEFEEMITHLTFTGHWKFGEIIMSKLTKQYGSFIILADGEPVILINAES